VHAISPADAVAHDHDGQGRTDNIGTHQLVPCRSVDPNWFFAESPILVDRAKEVCLGCFARMTCLAGAMERAEPWGVWGGELFIDGVIAAQKRARGRPRKHPFAAPAPLPPGLESTASNAERTSAA
jgi:WhiB family redox-sensing transcriptional regulator